MAREPDPYPDVGPRRRRRRRTALLGTAAAVAATVQAVSAAGAHAATNVACDSAQLIAALHAAADSGSRSGTLALAGGCTYSLTAADNPTDGGTGLPVIYGSATIQGNGATITRSGGPSFRIFEVAGGGSLSLSNLTISNGQANDTGVGAIGGGGILNYGSLSVATVTFTGNSSLAHSGVSGGAISSGSSSTLTITDSTFVGNSAQEGGAFLSQGTTTVTDSTFENNTATDFGGGAFVTTGGTTNVSGSTFLSNTATDTGTYHVGGGAIDNDAAANVDRSTFVNNAGGSNGGGAIQNFGTMRIIQSTIANNSAPAGANIHNFVNGSVPLSLTISQSIVANPGGGGTNCSGTAGVIVDGGYNLSSDASCEFSAAAHSKSGVAAGLQPLAANGGATQTMAIGSTSAAFDAIPANTPGCTGTTDQRGVSRPQGPACDIGAYEAEQVGPGGSTSTPPPSSPPPSSPPPSSPPPSSPPPSSAPPVTGTSAGQPVFRDLVIGAPFYDDIAWLAQQKLTTGFADGGFHPDSAVSRQAVAAYLYRYAHGGVDGGTCSGNPPFRDVSVNSPFCADIAWLRSAGLSAGWADGTFHPGEAISREALAAFLYRLAHSGKDAGMCTGASPFPDVSRTSAFCGAISWIAHTAPQAITTGFADGAFHPMEETSRQVIAAYLHRYDADFHGFGRL